MGSPVSRQWAAVHSPWLTKPAYRRLSPAGRGALLHVLLQAGMTTPEATWRDPAELAELMEYDGFAPDALAELIATGWLASTEDGLIVPSWDEMQWPASEAIRKRYEASRKADWRRRREPSAPLSYNSLPVEKMKSKDRKESRFVPDSPGPNVVNLNGGENPSSNGRGAPVDGLALGCATCGLPVPDREGRVTVYHGRTRMVHNVCPALAAAQ